MKRLILSAVLPLALCASSFADNYLTMGVNDTLRINPNYQGGTVTVPVRAHFDGRLDHWRLSMTYPGADTLSVNMVTRGPGMDVPYIDSLGVSQTFVASLTESEDDTLIYSVVAVTGYWDWNGSGNYAPYGNAKWEAGDYPAMFYMSFNISNPRSGGKITIDGILTSGSDARGGIIGYYVQFCKQIFVRFGYMLGDVNGDEVVDMTDVTLLISIVQTSAVLDAFQQEAADMNGDGIIEITDVTLLIQKVLTGA